LQTAASFSTHYLSTFITTWNDNELKLERPYPASADMIFQIHNVTAAQVILSSGLSYLHKKLSLPNR
jgi:hypothetical protein